jgi:hypothetical protein
MDLARPKRTHTICEAIIRIEGWTPYVLCDSIGTYWNGRTVREGNGHIIAYISDGLKEQMINLALDGYFGEAIKTVTIDIDRWLNIYHNLIDIPVEEIIAKESLRVMQISVNSLTSDPSSGQDTGISVSSGPTTGPVPHSWQGVVSRDAAPLSFTYVFQFGNRDLWKVGHATDLAPPP